MEGKCQQIKSEQEGERTEYSVDKDNENRSNRNAVERKQMKSSLRKQSSFVCSPEQKCIRKKSVMGRRLSFSDEFGQNLAEVETFTLDMTTPLNPRDSIISTESPHSKPVAVTCCTIS